MKLGSHNIAKIELSAKYTDELICKLASGKVKWLMSTPPQEFDTDMQLIREVREHIPSLIKHISIIETENEKLRDALKTLDFEVRYYLDNINAAWGYSDKQIRLKHAAEKALGELNG